MAGLGRYSHHTSYARLWELHPRLFSFDQGLDYLDFSMKALTRFTTRRQGSTLVWIKEKEVLVYKDLFFKDESCLYNLWFIILAVILMIIIKLFCRIHCLLQNLLEIACSVCSFYYDSPRRRRPYLLDLRCY